MSKYTCTVEKTKVAEKVYRRLVISKLVVLNSTGTFMEPLHLLYSTGAYVLFYVLF